MTSPGRQHDGLIDRLFELAADYPRATALCSDGIELDYVALVSRALVARRLLAKQGVGPGDRVLLSLTKSIDQVALLLGTWILGGVAVPVHPVYSNEQLESIVTDCQPRVIFVGRLRLASLEADRFRAPIEVVPESGSELTEPDVGEKAMPPDLPSDDSGVEPGALAVLFYESASAGRMTGVGWSHENLTLASRALLNRWGSAPSDRLGGLLCLNVPIGLLQLVQAIEAGLPLFLHSSVFPKDLFRFITEKQLTQLTLLPITIARMFHPRLYVASPEAQESVRSIVMSGRRPGAEAIARLQHEFPAAEIETVYGSREGLPLAWWSHRLEAWERVPEVELMVCRDPLPVSSNPGDSEAEYGELQVRGQIARGEWHRGRLAVDEATVLSTGDLVRSDDERGFDIRPAEDRIETQGYVVFPEEVERVFRRLPGLENSVAFGVPHEEWSSAIVVAWPKSSAAVEKRTLIAHAIAHLPGYMRPFDWVEIPAEFNSLKNDPIDSGDLVSLRLRLRAEYLSRPAQ